MVGQVHMRLARCPQPVDPTPPKGRAPALTWRAAPTLHRSTG